MSQIGPENPLYQLQRANRAGGEEPKTTEPGEKLRQSSR